MKDLVKVAYRVMKAIFYPLLVIFQRAIPAFGRSPELAVAGLSIALFAALSNVAVWITGSAWAAPLCWVAGIILAYGFARWGREFEEERDEPDQSGTRGGRDCAIFLGVVPVALLTLVAAHTVHFDGRETALALLVVITWLCILARYFYRPFGVFTLSLVILWLVGAVGLYGSFWGLTRAIRRAELLGAIAAICLLGFICIDYLVVPAEAGRRTARAIACLALLGGFLLIEADTLVSPVGAVVQASGVLGTLLLAISYWMVLAAKRGHSP